MPIKPISLKRNRSSSTSQTTTPTHSKLSRLKSTLAIFTKFRSFTTNANTEQQHNQKRSTRRHGKLKNKRNRWSHHFERRPSSIASSFFNYLQNNNNNSNGPSAYTNDALFEHSRYHGAKKSCSQPSFSIQYNNQDKNAQTMPPTSPTKKPKKYKSKRLPSTTIITTTTTTTNTHHAPYSPNSLVSNNSSSLIWFEQDNHKRKSSVVEEQQQITILSSKSASSIMPTGILIKRNQTSQSHHNNNNNSSSNSSCLFSDDHPLSRSSSKHLPNSSSTTGRPRSRSASSYQSKKQHHLRHVSSSNITVNSEDLTAKEFADMTGIIICDDDDEEEAAEDDMIMTTRTTPTCLYEASSAGKIIEEEGFTVGSEQKTHFSNCSSSRQLKIWDTEFWHDPAQQPSLSSISNKKEDEQEQQPQIFNELRQMQSAEKLSNCIIKKGRFEIFLEANNNNNDNILSTRSSSNNNPNEDQPIVPTITISDGH